VRLHFLSGFVPLLFLFPQAVNDFVHNVLLSPLSLLHFVVLMRHLALNALLLQTLHNLLTLLLVFAANLHEPLPTALTCQVVNVSV
jgi:hypothetical protein